MLYKSKKFHFIGIGGIGMSSLATILLEKNADVSGSDIASNAVTEALATKGAKITQGHFADAVSSDMTIVYSTDIKSENPEYRAALKLNCPMLHRSELLAQLAKGQKVLAVTGTHGKTTTTALLAWTLTVAGLDPTFSVGGILPQFKTNGKLGKGEHFVLEADESDGTFLRYAPHGAIVTNIGLDHMNHFKTEANLVQAFRTFMDHVEDKRLLFWCADDKRLFNIVPGGISYGFSASSRIQAHNFRQNGWVSSFDIADEGKTFRDVQLALLGRHNCLNALAVFGLAIRLGAAEDDIRQAFRTFKGVARRCEKKGEINGTLFLDDYAHHPTEIDATLIAIRQAIGKKRFIAVFQPHRYTRTHDCMGSYGHIFKAVDELLITDIYPAGEAPITGVDAISVLAEIKNADSRLSVRYSANHQLVEELLTLMRSGDVIVTLGAGSITKLAHEVIATYEAIKK